MDKIYAAVIRKPGTPPTQVPPFAASDDAAALDMVAQVAEGLGANVVMAWERSNGQCRRIA